MNKPKLLINLNILRNPLTGIGHYTLNIVKELLMRDVELIGIRQGAFLTREEIGNLVTETQSPQRLQAAQGRLKKALVAFIRAIPGAYRLKFFLQSQKIKSGLAKLAAGGYVYFEPCFVPFAYPGKIITTIHDLSFIIHPEYHPSTRVSYLKNQLTESIKNSTKLMVDSRAILEELHHYYPLSRNKSVVLYLGVNAGFKPYDEVESQVVLESLGLKYRSFLLSVSTLEPRKNLVRLVEAYAGLPEQIRRCFPLVLVGDSGWKNNGLLVKAAELFDKEQIIITGYLPDEALRKLYAAATLFVYPSLYEGFGLPIIEAMASGAAVITSNYGAMAEVAGEGAMLVDPYSVEDLKTTILTLLSDMDLCRKLRENGIKRAKQFQWKKTVDQLVDEIMR